MMVKVLAAWEMGANMGHIDRLLITARALRERGHEVVMALRDLARAQPRIAAEGFTMLQAPVWLHPMANPPKLNNYSMVLASAGWLDEIGLAGLVSAWRSLFALVGPQVLIVDHAPTALLACRGQKLLTWAIGNSFEIPPPGEHFAPAHHWVATEHARVAASDAVVLPVANRALARLGEPPLPRLTSLFEGVHQALVSPRELAHYDGYDEGVEWSGPSFVDDSGVEPSWPARPGPRVFAYLTPSHPQFTPTIKALGALGWPTLVHAKGMADDARRRLGGPGLRFEAQPVRMRQVLGEAAVVVSHASLGTVSAAMMAGVPQLVLPTHTEQSMVARRVHALGIGIVVPKDDLRFDHHAALERLVNEPGFTTAARQLAERYRGHRPEQVGRHVADRIEASLAGHTSVRHADVRDG